MQHIVAHACRINFSTKLQRDIFAVRKGAKDWNLSQPLCILDVTAVLSFPSTTNMSPRQWNSSCNQHQYQYKSCFTMWPRQGLHRNDLLPYCDYGTLNSTTFPVTLFMHLVHCNCLSRKWE